MTNFIINYKFQITYLLIILWLAIGVIVYSGNDYLHFLIIYSLAFIIFSFVFKGTPLEDIFSKVINNIKLNIKLDIISYTLISGTLLFIIIHYVYLGSIPLFEAFTADDNIEVAIIRQEISEGKSSFFNYISSFVIKAIIPFFILYLYYKKRNILLIIILSISFFYVVSLLQKSPILAIFFPVLIFTFFKKKFKHFFIFILISVIGILFLIFAANPLLYKTTDGKAKDRKHSEYIKKDPLLSGKKEKSTAYRVNYAILHRTFLVPGKMVSEWFDVIPSKYDYARGCEYRFLAPLLNCEFTNYSSVIYKELYSEYSDAGLTGTVNTASFMYDYANFGTIGLVISGFIIALWIVIIDFVFTKSHLIALSLNVFPLFMLSSSAFSTTLVSGGWGILVILFLIYKKEFKS